GLRTAYDVSRDELGELLSGEPRYRVDQVWRGMYEQLVAPSEVSTLPKPLRSRLAEELPLALSEEVRRVSDGGDTVKYLWRLNDTPGLPARHIETVLMLYPDRVTAC